MAATPAKSNNKATTTTAEKSPLTTIAVPKQVRTVNGCPIVAGANCPGVDLSNTELAMNNLAGANLSGSDLSGSDLWGANLTGTDLSRADLRGANVIFTKHEGANFTGAKSDTQTTCLNGHLGPCHW